ncbi:MAG: alanine/glycine:cation symporter family protein [Mobilicoccus sp.]|nr:alanine/glycine:cation symporter family protein [Mobilicoccus sp.]
MTFEDVISFLNDIIWSNWLVGLCLLAGLYFTIRLKLVQVWGIPDMFKQLRDGGSSEQGVSSFQALAMSLAGRVGTGNIAGVATAIAFGGPGAVFWMWTMAFLGAATSFVECALGQVYKEEDAKGQYRGGPAYFIEKSFAHTAAAGFFRVYAAAFAVVCVVAMAFFLPGIQSNSIAHAMENAWGFAPLAVALGVVIVLAFIIVGGVKRIAIFAGTVVPFMALGYIILAIIVLTVNAGYIPEMFRLIVSSAFGAEAAFGGMLGFAIEWGVKRGLYSNEAGQGTGPHPAAAAEVSHPAKQGLAQAFAVYIDTLLVCSATAFMILSTGMYRVHEGSASAEIIYEGSGGLAESARVGPAFTQAALDTVFPGFGSSFVAIALAFFAFTTIVAYYYMAETNITYLFRNASRAPQEITRRLVQLLILVAVAYGATVEPGAAWDMGDVGVGLMAWLNIVAILIMQVPAIKVLKDYQEQKKRGIDPQFDPRELDIKNAPWWEARADRLGYGRGARAQSGTGETGGATRADG